MFRQWAGHPGRTWRRALAVSLGLHLLGAALVLWTPSREPRPAPAPCSETTVALLEPDPAPTEFLAARSNGATITLSPIPLQAMPVNLRQPGGSHRTGTISGTEYGNGGSSTAASSRLFPVGPAATSVVFVLDRSSSMGFGSGLERAREELQRSIADLPRTARFQIIVFNQMAGPLVPAHPGLLDATPENRALLAEALDRLQPAGGTKHEHALPLALALQPEIIYFLTDADDLTSAYVDSITARNRGRSVIHTIELSSANRGRPDSPLQRLARHNRGSYLAVNLDTARP